MSDRRIHNLLTPETVIAGYHRGVFPMADETGEIYWFSPNPRGVLPLDAFHLPHGLRRTLRRNIYEIRVNTAFGEVIRGCARREETWISPSIINVFEELHARGIAHSVEAWREGKLAGGLYGASIGGVFFGESMFSRRADASKAALAALVERLRSRRYGLLDVQWNTPHLAQFGVIEIPRIEYLYHLSENLSRSCRF